MPAGARVFYGSVALLATVAALGCNLDNPGDDPPPGLLYFPNAIALTQHASGETPRYLLVANSDFDLRYKHGTVQAMSLDDVAQRCRRTARDEPGCEIEPESVIEDEVFINPFSTSLAVSRRQPPGVRADAHRRQPRVHPSRRRLRPATTCSAAANRDANAACAPSAARPSSEPGEQIDWPPDPVAVISGPAARHHRRRRDRRADRCRRHPGQLRDRRAPRRRGQPVRAATRRTGDLLRQAIGGLPAQITELAFDPVSKLVHFSVLNGGSSKLLGARRCDRAARRERQAPISTTRFCTRRARSQLEAVEGSATRATSRSFRRCRRPARRSPAPRALVVSRSPSALLVVDVDASEQRQRRAAACCPGTRASSARSWSAPARRASRPARSAGAARGRLVLRLARAVRDRSGDDADARCGAEPERPVRGRARRGSASWSTWPTSARRCSA